VFGVVVVAVGVDVVVVEKVLTLFDSKAWKSFSHRELI